MATPEEAELVFYNTCSIRDKAEQKVFHRLDQFKRDGKGKTFARARVRGAAGRREDLRESSAREPGVRLGQLQQAAARCWCSSKPGNRRVTGLSLDTEETFETPLTRRDNPHRAYITIIEGCDKILRLLRGAVHARAGAQPHQRIRDLREARELAAMGYTRDPVAGPEREQLSRSVARGLGFRDAAGRGGRVPGIRRVRFTTSHPRDFVKAIIDAIDRESGAVQSRASAGAVRIDAHAGRACSASTRAKNTCSASSG